MDDLAASEDDDAAAEIPHPGAPGAITARRALGWWASGLAFWRRAPFRLLVVCLVPLLLEGVVQLIPLAGTPVSKVVVPFVSTGVLVVLDRLWTSGHFEWRGLLWSFEAENRWPALQVALIMALVFVLQMACVIAMFGFSAFDAVVLGHFRQHPELMSRSFELALILPGSIPGALLMFTAPLVVLQRMQPLEAAKWSIRLMLSSPAALGVFCLVSALVTAAALLWGYGLLLLLAVPWMILTGYAAYRDVYADSGARNGAERSLV